MSKEEKEAVDLVVELSQKLVNTHQVITVGSMETAAVRIDDVNNLKEALKDLYSIRGEIPSLAEWMY